MPTSRVILREDPKTNRIVAITRAVMRTLPNKKKVALPTSQHDVTDQFNNICEAKIRAALEMSRRNISDAKILESIQSSD